MYFVRLQAACLAVRALCVLGTTVAATSVLLSNSAANGAMIVVNTPAGSTTGGQPVSARATITTGANQVVVFLENLQANPRSMVQAISGFRFHLDSGQTTGSLTSSSGKHRTIHSNGTFVDGANAASGWALTKVGSDLMVSFFDTPAAPQHTIIGPPGANNLYSNANASIKNGIHSPFFGLNATFTLNVPGVTAGSTVSGTVFHFNSGPGNSVAGTDIPEPSALACAAIGLLTLAGPRRRR